MGDRIVRAKISQQACVLAHGKWLPFDISGHTFLASLGICLLLEELTRYYGEPVFYFTIHSCQGQSQGRVWRIKAFWWTSVSISVAIVLVWSILYLRTAWFYHTLQEKAWGTAVGTAYWWFVVLVRLVVLYLYT